MLRRLLPAFALLLAIPMLSCSPNDGASDAVARAAKNSIAQESVDFAITGVQTPDYDEDMDSLEMAGTVDFALKRTRYNFTETSDPAIEMSWVIIIDGRAAYLQYDEEWMKFRSRELGLAHHGGIFELLAARPRAEFVGDETLADRPLKQYRLVLSTEDTMNAIGFVDLFDVELYSGEITVDAWIDEDNLIARLQLTTHPIEDDPEFEPFILMATYSSYGTAGAIDLPDPDEIVDFADDDSSIVTSETFDGWNCWGDATHDCLQPNPEVVAMAQDPALCAGPEARVCLAPIGFVRTDVVEAVLEFHKRTKDLDIVILPSIPVDPAAVDPDTFQVTEVYVYDAIKAAHGVEPTTASTFIALTPFDMVPEDGRYGWYFGNRFRRPGLGQQDGVFSTFRMENVEPYSGDPLTDALIQERVTKYFARYVAVLHYDHAFDTDIDYLNYHEMYGFSDLDSMGMNWPVDPPPCSAGAPVICIVPDQDWLDWEFEADLEAAVQQLQQTLGMRVDVYLSGGYYPTKPSWSDEMRDDLHFLAGRFLGVEGTYVLGVTDDALSQDPSVPEHTDRYWLDENLAVVSGFDAGDPGSAERQERLYRLLLRAALRLTTGEPLSSDPSSLFFEGVTHPGDLDAATLPPD